MTPAADFATSPPPAAPANAGAGPRQTADDDLDRMPLNKRLILNHPGGSPSSTLPPSKRLRGPTDMDNKQNLQKWPGLPRGVKFIPSDRDLVWHLLAKVSKGRAKPHPFISNFITCLDGVVEFYCTHPENLPGVKKDGSLSFFFHKPLNAVGTESGKCLTIDTCNNRDFSWHDIGKAKRIIVDQRFWGFKKKMGLFTNTEKDEKPAQTYWVVHQYYLDMKVNVDREYVVSKIFHQAHSSMDAQNNVENVHKNIDPVNTIESIDPELDRGNWHSDCSMVQASSQGTFLINHGPENWKDPKVWSTNVFDQESSQGDEQLPMVTSDRTSSGVEGNMLEGENILRPSKPPENFREVKAEACHYGSKVIEENMDSRSSMATSIIENEKDELDHISLIERRKLLFSRIGCSNGLKCYSGCRHCVIQPSASNLHDKYVGSVSEINQMNALETICAKDFLGLLQGISSGPSLEDDMDERNTQELKDKMHLPHMELPGESFICNGPDNNMFNSANGLIDELSDKDARSSSVVTDFSFNSANCQRNLPSNPSFCINNNQTKASSEGISGAQNCLNFRDKKQANAKKPRKQKFNQKLEDSVPSTSGVEIKAEPLDPCLFNTISDAIGGKDKHVEENSLFGDSRAYCNPLQSNLAIYVDNISLGNISTNPLENPGALSANNCQDRVLDHGNQSLGEANQKLSNCLLTSEVQFGDNHLDSLSRNPLTMASVTGDGGPLISCGTLMADVLDKRIKREIHNDISMGLADNVQLTEDNKMLAMKSSCNLISVKTIDSRKPFKQNNTADSASGFRNPSSLRRKRKKTATNSLEEVLEEDAPELLKLLLENGIMTEEMKLYGEADDCEPIEISSADDSFEDLENVINKLFCARECILKQPMIRNMKESKVIYCMGCLISLIEQARYLIFRSSPVEWGWCRELQSFIFVFQEHNRIVLERPEYGYATYFFELLEALPIDWQIKRLITAMKLSSCSRSTLIENKPLVVGEDLTEGEAHILEEYGWKPNTGLGSMLYYCNRVVHDRKFESFTSEWRTKMGRFLMEGFDGGKIVLEKIPNKAAKFVDHNQIPEMEFDDLIKQLASHH